MFSSFDEESIGCQYFHDLKSNRNLSSRPTTKSTPGNSKVHDSMGRDILSALKNLQDRLLQLEKDKDELQSDRDQSAKSLASWEKHLTSSSLPCASKPSPYATPKSLISENFIPPNFSKSHRQSLTSQNSSRQETRHDGNSPFDIGNGRFTDKSPLSGIQEPCPRMNEFDLTMSSINNSFHPLEPAGSSVCQLECANAKCQVLEKELENMRSKVCSAERDRALALENQVRIEKEKLKLTKKCSKTSQKISLLSSLESQNQELSEKNKVMCEQMQKLEDEVEHQKHQRQLILDRAVQLETQATAQKIIDANKVQRPQRCSPRPGRKVNERKIQHEAPVRLRNKSQPQRPRSSSPHYKLNLADLPFITGTSASPSPGFSARIQKLLYELKAHNPKICGPHGKNPPKKKPGSPKKPCSTRKNSKIDDWEDSLLSENLAQDEEDLKAVVEALQDEFCKLTDEHKVLRKQMELTADCDAREQLAKQLVEVTSAMDQKAGMIGVLKNLQFQIKDMIDRKHEEMSSKRRSKRNSGVSLSSSQGSTPRKHVFKKPGAVAKQRKDLLREVEAFQQGLKRDDISWD